MADFIPQGNAKFNLWQGNMTEIIELNLVLWAITAEDWLKLNALRIIWNDTFAIASNRKNRTSADVRARVDARKDYTKELRKFIGQWLSNNSKVTNSDRMRMGLTVKSGTRTPVSVPVSSPVGIIAFSSRMQHKIHFNDQATPRSKAKPAGVQGCEIWVKIDGSAPVNASELTYIAIATRTPYLIDFEGKNIGKYVYYWLRWVNKRGKYGPWSSSFNAIIPG